MKILVTAPGEFTGANLKPGYYHAEPAGEGTDQQRKTFYALLQVYWASGMHSYNATNFVDFCEAIKYYLGAGSEKYNRLVDNYGKPLEKPQIDYRVKSFKEYTKSERANAITNVIGEMLQAGVDSKKFYEILSGLEERRAG